MKKIAIRADGGKGIGMGHIMRTSVLAKELLNFFEVFYICLRTDDYVTGIQYLESQHIEVRLIDDHDFFRDVSRLAASLLIIDHYNIDGSYLSAAKKSYYKTMYIDDLHALPHYDTDIILNQNISAESLSYPAHEHTLMFLGTQYTLLRDEFRSMHTIRVKDEAKDILITLGASDIHCVTGQILEYVKNLRCHFHVVVGNAFVHIGKLKKLENENKNIHLYFNANMSEVMRRCQVALSTGSTLYELCALGIPTIGISIADYQLKELQHAKNAGIIYEFISEHELSEKRLCNALTQLCVDKETRLSIANKQLLSVNAKGAEAVVLKIKENL